MTTRGCRHFRLAIVVIALVMMAAPTALADRGLCPRIVNVLSMRE